MILFSQSDCRIYGHNLKTVIIYYKSIIVLLCQFAFSGTQLKPRTLNRCLAIGYNHAIKKDYTRTINYILVALLSQNCDTYINNVHVLYMFYRLDERVSRVKGLVYIPLFISK